MYKEQCDVAVGTDFSRRLLAPNDWYYSQLFRRLLKQHYAKFKQPIRYEVENSFKAHDQENYYRDLHEPNPNASKNSKKVRPVTKNLFLDSDSACSMDDLNKTSPLKDNLGKPENSTVRQLSEQEVKYLINIYKNKT